MEINIVDYTKVDSYWSFDLVSYEGKKINWNLLSLDKSESGFTFRIFVLYEK